ncbi:DUF1579 family protein [Alkalicoccus saliphilus]|nr:DUF1579 family protein [Alkalicoccus saliphilus]
MNSLDSGSAMERLEILEGIWDIEIVFPHPGTEKIHGETAFEWMKGGHFLIQKTKLKDPGAPESLIIIGFDADIALFKMHYFDSRGIDRLYNMTLDKNVWKQWRNNPGFHQRFKGEFNDTLDLIEGVWEKSADKDNWEHDFLLTFRKTSD